MKKFQNFKIDDLREGLERLKIRNRNLKDFLQTIDKPLIEESPEATICSKISNLQNVDSPLIQQTRSNLLATVKVLENECRSKDAVIEALTDELGSSRKGFESSNDEVVKILVTSKHCLNSL